MTDVKHRELAAARALELIDLTLDDPRHRASLSPRAASETR